MVEPSSVSVVIPCHTERRWDHLVRAVASVYAQEIRPVEVVVAVDYNDALFERARRELTGVTVVANRFQRGVSGNRNTGVLRTRTPFVALLDDDAYAYPKWLSGLARPFEDDQVIGTGGAICPMWERPRPAWFPDEFLWVVGGSYTGMPTMTAPVRNVWSASMAVRRDAFDAVGGFRVGFGKLGDRARPEDTDLCLRMSQATGGRWMYVPDALIDHPVQAERTRLRFFLNRCYQEGRGKVELARLNKGHQESLTSERGYLTRTLPVAVGRGLADAVRGRGAAHAARAAAVVAGFAAAATGGAVESVLRYRTPRPAAAVVPAGESE